MSTNQAPAQSLHLPSTGQFALSGFGLLTLLTAAVGLAAGALAVSGGSAGGGFSAGSSSGDNPFYALAWIAGFFALLTVPSVGYSLARLLGKDTTAFEQRAARLPLRISTLCMLLWPLALISGNLLAQNMRLGWVLLPPLQIASVAIPLWWIIELVRRRLPGTSAQRVWGALNFSFLVSTCLILLVEILLLFAAALAAGIVIALQPEWSSALERLVQRLAAARANPEVALRVIKPLLQQPLVLISLLAGAAGVVPLVEELIKPLGLWFLAGRKMSPAAGFILGAASGAGFALLESLGVMSNPLQDGWAVLAVGRMGTGLLHISTSALVGWGLAVAWGEGKYLKLGLSYALAVFLHGLWNIFGLLMGLTPLLQPAPPQIALFVRLGEIGPLALAVLAGILFIFLWVSNHILQLQQAKIMVNSTPAEIPAGDILNSNPKEGISPNEP